MYKSQDGLFSSQDPEAVALWESITLRQENDKAQWTKTLRDLGVKLAHPDDGWVTRDTNEPYLTLSWYPQFNDQPQVGDLIALGYGYGPHWAGNFNYRICRVTKVETGGTWIPYTKLFFEDTGARLPPLPPRKRCWTRKQHDWNRTLDASKEECRRCYKTRTTKQ